MTSPNQNQPKAHITVFCLNLRFGLADDGPHNWEIRKQAYPNLLKKHPADFYAFQEANDFQTSYLQALLPDHKVIGQRSPAPDAWQNNVIFHHRRWTCRNSEHFYLSDTPHIPSKFEESQWPRQCTLGTFQKHHWQLTVINTHFDFKPEVQQKSAALIINRLKNIAPNQPVILMGDFNAGPHSPCVTQFTAGTTGFKSAFEPHRMGTHHNFQGIAKGEPIDWILYSGEIEKRDARMVTTPEAGIYPSDHFPLVAKFSYTIHKPACI